MGGSEYCVCLGFECIHVVGLGEYFCDPEVEDFVYFFFVVWVGYQYEVVWFQVMMDDFFVVCFGEGL